jgi:hypothetical protein
MKVKGEGPGHLVEWDGRLLLAVLFADYGRFAWVWMRRWVTVSWN